MLALRKARAVHRRTAPRFFAEATRGFFLSIYDKGGFRSQVRTNIAHYNNAMVVPSLAGPAASSRARRRGSAFAPWEHQFMFRQLSLCNDSRPAHWHEYDRTGFCSIGHCTQARPCLDKPPCHCPELEIGPGWSEHEYDEPRGLPRGNKLGNSRDMAVERGDDPSTLGRQPGDIILIGYTTIEFVQQWNGSIAIMACDASQTTDEFR